MMMTMGLTPRQKAAVIVRLLLAEGGEIRLDALPESAQAALAEEMSQMGMIDRTTRDAVISEFCDSLEEVGIAFPEGLDNTLDILGSLLSQDTTDRLRRRAAMTGRSDPWERIAAMSVGHIRDLAMSEALEVVAVMFSKLPVPKAAEVFGLLPPVRARQIAYAMSLTGNIEAAALRRIGMALMQAADTLSRPAIDGAPVEKVGAILNFSPANTRDEVLTGLDEDDRDFADNVRKAIFTWAIIPKRIDPRDVPRICREVDQTVLVKAMTGSKGEDEKTVEFILTSLSSRLADSLREEMQSLGKVSAKDAEDAMAEVVGAIRRMEGSGDLFLIAAEADEA